ncbi:MAG: hypothetical protein IJ167_00460 [Lachnospiraceae bacterium]|nr:hypothetical protein [Lachnospiraceae bacterium]
MEKLTNAELCNKIWEKARLETDDFKYCWQVSIIEKITAHFDELSPLGDVRSRWQSLLKIKERLDKEETDDYKNWIIKSLSPPDPNEIPFYQFINSLEPPEE